MTTNFALQIGLSIIGGVVPAIIWLMFWLREDDEHPEPRGRILATFVLGMLMVPIALALQLAFNWLTVPSLSIHTLVKIDFLFGTFAVVVWALIEEVLKLKAAYFGGLHQRDADEAIDAPIYAITAALGFAALENILFLVTPLLQGDTTTALITTNMRFIGATLLHVATAAIIGICIAFSYFRSQRVKKRYLLGGVIGAVCLHSLFNLFIIISKNTTMIAFVGVWILIVVIIIIFERIKRIHVNKI